MVFVLWNDTLEIVAAGEDFPAVVREKGNRSPGDAQVDRVGASESLNLHPCSISLNPKQRGVCATSTLTKWTATQNGRLVPSSHLRKHA